MPRTRAFIKESEQKPFFLICAFHDPHRAGKGFGNEPFAKDPKEVKYNPKDVIVPYHLPDCEAVRKDLADYYQSVSRMDRGVGMLMDVLRELGQLDDTLIIFVSDNGIPFPGAKTTLYNSGINLPLIVAGPGVPQGRTNNGLVNFVDLAPTILDWTKAAGRRSTSCRADRFSPSWATIIRKAGTRRSPRTSSTRSRCTIRCAPSSRRSKS